MRDLTKTIAVATLLVPASAQPLGIGELKLHSALNQRLNAEINLVLSGEEKASDIRVQLAPPEKFDEAGVPWSYFLSKIDFDKIVKPDGNVVVKLSSNEALREPFLNFLLEVRWDQGNLYREFTVLIDPPTAYQQPVMPVVEHPQPAETTIRKTVIEPVARPQPRPMLVPRLTADSYGPTDRRDTLWDIAEKTKPSSQISTEQMMVAIFEANPQAFYKDNVNALMAGHTLRIPEQQAVLKLSKAQAAAVFKQQMRAWKHPESVKKGPQASAELANKQSSDTVQLDLVAPSDEELSQQVAVTPGQEQAGDMTAEASAEESTTGTGTDKTVAGGDAALQSRLDRLEQQIAMMQKLLALKDEQLAALQNKDSGQTVVVPESSVATGAEHAAEQPKQKVVTNEVKPEVMQPLPKSKPKPVQPAVEPESGFLGDAYSTIVGGLGLVLLGGLGFLWWRKRKVEEQTDTDSMFAASSEIRMPDSEDAGTDTASFDGASAYDVGTVGESSFLSEFTPSDFDAFDNDQHEVDPISEADVYLAYGRYQQAEELMRAAIVDDPERDECKLKLLEIFYANENKEAFELYANELKQAGKHNDPNFWAKVVEMGAEIIPGSALLTIGKSSKAEFDNAAADRVAFIAEKEDKAADQGADFAEDSDADIAATDEVLSPTENDSESNNDSLDFDLSAFTDAEPETDLTQTDNDENIESVEFDLSSGPDENEDSQKIPSPADASLDDDLETFDFNFEAPADDDQGSHKDQNLSMDDDSVENVLDSFDLSALGGETEATEEKGSPDISLGDSDDEFDFNFDFEDASLSDSSATGDGTQGEVDDLTDMDEFETKIDLAKAYIDMGDSDAARTIAEEVLEKGSDAQKNEAQSLLDQLK